MTDTDENDDKSRSLGGLFSRLRVALGGKEQSEEPMTPDNGLGKLRVDDVMIPTAEVIAVPVDVSRDELVQTFRESGLTRLPIYRDTLDQPLGFIHLKDFALTYGFGATSEQPDLQALMRPLLFVPPSMRAAVLLQKMQKQRSHMALVIDEYGSVDGLVTLEDLIEELVGEIEDEHDEEEAALWHEEKPGVWMAQAIADLDEFSEAIGVKLATAENEEDVETLGGLVAMLAGRVPPRGEVFVNDEGVSFEVVDASPRRIRRLRIRLPDPKPETE